MLTLLTLGGVPGLSIEILAWGGLHIPPIGGDKGPIGGDWCVIGDKIWRCLKCVSKGVKMAILSFIW